MRWIALAVGFALVLCLMCFAVWAGGRPETTVEVLPAVQRPPGKHAPPTPLLVPLNAVAVRMSVDRRGFTQGNRELCFGYRLSLDGGTTFLPGGEGCIQPFSPGKREAPSGAMELSGLGLPGRVLEVWMEVKRGVITAPLSVTWIE